MNKIVWIVGQWTSKDGTNYTWWEFQGIFEKEKDAVKACRNECCFVGPVELNKEYPISTTTWPGSYFPPKKKGD